MTLQNSLSTCCQRWAGNLRNQTVEIGHRITNSGSHYASKAWSVISPVVSVAGGVYEKLPLIKNISQPVWNTAAHIAQEAPQYVGAASSAFNHLRKGHPLNAFGQRFALRGHQTIDAEKCLTDIDAQLIRFSRLHPTDRKGSIPSPDSYPHAAPMPNISSPSAPSRVEDLRLVTEPEAAILPSLQSRQQTTERNREIFSENLSNFLSLYAMTYIGNLPNINPQDINALVQAASVPDARGNKPSLKSLFLAQYGSQMSWFQRQKIFFFNLFGLSTVVSKTVNAYLGELLKEMRTRLSQWTANGNNTERMINDLIHFLDVYKGATLNYAEDRPPRGTLSQYRQAAFEQMFGKTLPVICKDFSSTFIHHIAPPVKYWNSDWLIPRLVNRILNRFVRFIVHLHLPQGLESAVLQANAATKPHHLPFVKAMTVAITEQLEQLHASLESTHSPAEPAPPLPGTARLDTAISNLLYVLQFTGCNTQEAIQKKAKELATKSQSKGLHATIDGKIHEGIQEALIQGTNVLLHHMAKEANTEIMFTRFFELANISFTRGAQISEADLETAKNKLELVMRNLGKKMAKDAIEPLCRPYRPEQKTRDAEKAFRNHHEDAKMMAGQLTRLSRALTGKASALEEDPSWDVETDILPELDAMHQVLRGFSTKEQIAIDLRGLPEADRQSVILPFTPIYEQIRLHTDKLLSLQTKELLHQARHRILEDFNELDRSLLTIDHFDDPEEALTKEIPHIETLLSKQLAPRFVEHSIELKEIERKLQEAKTALQEADKFRKQGKRLARFEQEMVDLAHSIANQKSESRKIILQRIKGTLRELAKEAPLSRNGPLGEQQILALSQLVEQINDLSTKLPFNQDRLLALWTPLQKNMRTLQGCYEEPRTVHLENWKREHTALHRMVQLQIERQELLQKDQANAIRTETAALVQEIGKMSGQIHQLTRENQLKLTPAHWGIAGGLMLGGAAYLWAPFTALAAGASLYAGIREVGPILQGGSQLKVALGKIGTQAVLATGAAWAASQVPVVGPALVVAGSAVAGGAVGKEALDRVIDGAQEKVYLEIVDFFGKAYEFALSGDIYQPAAKIAMNQVIASYTRS